MDNNENIVLSASKIKSVQTCSWMYWQQYKSLIPQASGEAATLGSITHSILEYLFNKKRKKLVENFIKVQKIDYPPLLRLVNLLLKKNKVYNSENFDKIINYTLVGLSNNFYFDGADEVYAPEMKFEIEDNKKRFKIKGFIDSSARYGKKVIIRDYKSSKSKFGNEDVKSNLQALIYQWAIKKLKNLESEIEFVFLRFKKNPIQKVETLSEATLIGLEDFLAYMDDYLKKFSKKDAYSNFGKDNGNHFLCGKDIPGKWICPYQKSVYYYGLFDENGVLLKSSLDKDSLEPKENQVILDLQSSPCPRFIKRDFELI